MRALLWIALAGCLCMGCPRTRPAPDPLDAEPCTTYADCNCGPLCGALRACAGGFCEAPDQRSLVVPCTLTVGNGNCGAPTEEADAGP